MERVAAQCRKCGLAFTTGAMTRTTCPGCKAAVTVRRDESAASLASGDESGNEASGVSLSIGALIALAFVIGLWFMGGFGSPGDPPG